MKRLAGMAVVAALLAAGCDEGKRAAPSAPPPATNMAASWYAGWHEASALNIGRAGAAVVIVGDHIYMIGGVDGRDFLRSVEYARINADGSLSPWQQTSPLNEERGFVDATASDGWIYVIGGGKGPNGQILLRSVERAAVRPDGSLGPWETQSTELMMPRRCSKVVLAGDALYAFGGFGGALLDTVERAPILADGSVGAWVLQEERMTVPRYISGVQKVGDRILMIGGHDQSKGVGITDVEWATLPQSGSQLGGWRTASPLKVGRYGLGSANNGRHVYAVGGLTGLEYVASVEIATLNVEGGISEWRETTSLSTPRAEVSVIAHNDHIYVLGGTNSGGYLTTVEYARFSDNGDIGVLGDDEQQRQYQAKLATQAAVVQQLPNEGIVRSVLQASIYSYLEVASPRGEIWLAGPLSELKPGDRIQFSEGVYMSNFYSKELQRQFPAVLFVGTIRKVE